MDVLCRDCKTPDGVSQPCEVDESGKNLRYFAIPINDVYNFEIFSFFLNIFYSHPCERATPVHLSRGGRT